MVRHVSVVVAVFALMVSPSLYAQLAGDVIYTGTESGSILVEAFTEQDQSFEKLSTDMINPGPFSFENVSEGSYTVIAFVDIDGNARLDTGEPWADGGEKIDVPPGDDNIVLNIDDYVPPGEEGSEDDDEGCCATLSPKRTPVELLLLLVGFVAWRRRKAR